MPGPSPKTNRPPAISIEGCTVVYGDNVAIDDVTTEVKTGSITAIIGPNGSGKTTLLKAVLGLIPVESGTIRMFGKPVDDVRKLIGYVPQRLEFDLRFPITVEEFLDLARHKHNPKTVIVEKLMEVGLPQDTAKAQLGKLSGGQLQRVLIAQAILNDPMLLILDEPSSGIDIVGERAFYDIIEHLNDEHNATVVLVSHELAIVSEIVDFVICLNRKLMCSGPPHQTLTESAIDELFGYRTRFYGHDKHENAEPVRKWRPHRNHRRR
ncbi:MAG: metal ABC transporter ATP-binding protein [Patescibacteria group bacterium]|nr:metal ABC transporter ATP-binding protein [Patescibacteria group bacterium]